MVISFIVLLCAIFSPCCASEEVTECEKVFTPLFGPAYNPYLGESHSGMGSGFEQTKIIRTAIPKLLEEYGCQTLVDAPCGDFYWMSHTPLKVKKYIGVDVIRELVKTNQEKYGSDVCSFVHLDMTQHSVPAGDMILCRDCLVHLSYAEIAQVLALFKKSGCRYLLTTTFPSRKKNKDIVTGKWRPLNLMAPPFNFPQPLAIIEEGCTERKGKYWDKSLALWNLSDIP